MPQVNGDNLLHQQIVKRTIEALQAQDEAFAIEYETASDADLIAYVRQCVDASYTPAPCEIVGGAYIAQRFGNWSEGRRAAFTVQAAAGASLSPLRAGVPAAGGAALAGTKSETAGQGRSRRSTQEPRQGPCRCQRREKE